MTKYDQIIYHVFKTHFIDGMSSFEFDREELVEACDAVGIKRIKNIGDIPYSFKYRKKLPEKILDTQPKGYEWSIYSVGRTTYQFKLLPILNISPNSSYSYVELLDATPGIIRKYSLSDEQALLAVLRYNRIIDIFLGITCYSLQSHLKTAVPGLGGMETDELYIGVDKEGTSYVIPVEAKGGSDKIGRVQIDQDFAMCKYKFPDLLCIPIAAQFLEDGKIALFRFEKKDGLTLISEEKHYSLVRQEE